jgi:N-acetylglucosamine-6-phosphate deacetylase
VLLHNARIVLPERTAEKASLLIHDGRIGQIIEPAPSQSPTADSVIDLSGLTVFPGLIDVHIHGAVGVDTMEATTEGLNRVSEFLASQGVTAWLPTLVPAAPENYQSAIRAIEQLMHEQSKAENEEQAGRLRSQQESRSIGGARVLGVHYEGPFVNTAQCGALRSAHFRSFSSVSDLDSLAIPDDMNAVRMMTLAPEIDGGLNLVEELNKRGWVVSIGHTRADTGVLDGAFKAGAHHLTHFMNAMAPLHHRSPGPVGWGLSRDDVTCDVIADGVHLVPDVLKLLVKLKTSDRLTLISDSIAAAGQGDGEYRIWDETIAVKHGRTRNERGSIAGSVITMLDAAIMMKSLGVSETDLAHMTATNPARLLRVIGQCGSIEIGKRADLIALNDAGDVRLTIIGGRVAYQA